MFAKENDPEGKYPKLKGQAGEVKHLSKALAHVFDMYKDAGNIIHSQISLMIKKFVQMDDILDAHSPHLYPKIPLPQAVAFENAGFDELALATSIANHYMLTDPKPLFSITIKCHYIIHIAVGARYLNPRLAMCYSGEDYMHHMKRMVTMSVRGTKPVDVCKKMGDKIANAMHQEMRE